MQDMFEKYPDVLTVKQLQEALSIGKNSAYNLIKSKKIKSIKIGSKTLIPKVFLIEFVENSCYNDSNNGLASVINGGAT